VTPARWMLHSNCWSRSRPARLTRGGAPTWSTCAGGALNLLARSQILAGEMSAAAQLFEKIA
jgi:hypothetical protein